MTDELFTSSTVSRRGFLKVCTLAAGAVGLPAWAAGPMAAKAASRQRPSVVWLHFQECTGCTESLLRTSHPDVGELILNLVSLDYHETLFAASGPPLEEALEAAVHQGDYLLIIEGAIPTKENGTFCQVGGHTALDSLKRCAEKASAIICIGSCASWGGVPSADPNPTGAVGAPEILLADANLKTKPMVTLPGCPANPYNLLGTVLQFATFGTLPKLDQQLRPIFAYSRTIHEDCPRRPHFDTGRFARKFGDQGHLDGYCLYQLGCKGPATHANCSLNHFGEVVGAWPVGIGHPCFGCTEQKIGFRIPLHDTVDVEQPTAPGTYPPIKADHSVVTPAVAGLSGLVIGALAGAGIATARKLMADSAKDEKKE